MKSFIPGPEHAGELRAALGQFTTGVCVVTCAADDGPLGMTVNSFTSVSLNPPLILWCPAKVSLRHDAYISAEHFAIHILTAAQHPLALAFAREGGAFNACDWTEGGHGTPLIHDTCARFECAREQSIDAGDHTIVLGRVTRVTTQEATPLAFQAGHFGAFKDNG